MSSWILAVLLAVIGGFAYLQRSAKHRRLPPGPRGLPIIGHIHMLGQLPHRSLHRLAKKYGPIMYLRLGLVPTVVVSSPQAAELFLKTHDTIFANRPENQASKYLSYGRKGLAFAEYGPYWRNIRKLCTLRLLSSSKIDSFKGMRREEVALLIQSLKDAAKDRAVVDISAKVGNLIEDMTHRMLFGHSRDEGCEFKPVIQEALNLVGTFNIADYIPYVGALDLQGLARRMKSCSRASDEFLEKMIDAHVRDARDPQEQHRDFIDVMLSLMMESKDTQDDQQYKMDRTHIKAILFDMLVGSIDTSTTSIEWTLSELIRHPKMMKKLQEEIEGVVGMDRVVEETDLAKFDYLDMVVKESMRIHPVAPFLVPHESVEDITINGYHIPKKSRIIINAWTIGRDPDVWSSNAEEFSPERFIDTNIDVRGRDFQLIPFGSGRRGCPGIQLGMIVVRLVVAQLVHCFDWKLPDGMVPDELDMSETFGLAAPRANHLLAVPTYRLCVKTL